MLIMDRDQLVLISDGLSIITILMCLGAKVPQIRTIYSLKSAAGISPLALYLELFSYTVTTAYNYCNGYSIMSYLEYPILLVQDILLVYLVLKYKRKLGGAAYLIALIYFVVNALIVTNCISCNVLTLLVPFCTPIGATSKVLQLLEIFRTKDASSVNLNTWMISALSNLTRIYTVLVDSADIMLVCNFGISFLLSSSVYLTAYSYKKTKTA